MLTGQLSARIRGDASQNGGLFPCCGTPFPLLEWDVVLKITNLPLPQGAGLSSGKLNCMPLIVLRLIFLLVAIGVGVGVVRSDMLPAEPDWLPWVAFGGMLMMAMSVIALDMLVPRKQLDIISSVYFGLIVGLFLRLLG